MVAVFFLTIHQQPLNTDDSLELSVENEIDLGLS